MDANGDLTPRYSRSIAHLGTVDLLECSGVEGWYNHSSAGAIGEVKRGEPKLMDDAVRKALEVDLVIDITTAGRKTGRPRRKEIWFHNLDGELYITGTPGQRDWYANLLAVPEFTFHLKTSARADLPARATPIVDVARRLEIFGKIQKRIASRLEMDVDAWVKGSPLVQVEITVP